MGNLLLDLIFPTRCFGCNRLGKYICSTCSKTIQFRPPLCPECNRQSIEGITHPYCVKSYGLNGLVSICYYDRVVKKAIKFLKYRFVSDAAETLVSLVPQDSYSFLPKDTRIYPMPLHAERLKWRGFNQAQKLAQFLSRRLGFEIVSNLLIRKKQVKAQADIAAKAERILNAQGIFSIIPGSLPKYIVLFDDVYTTGATMKEATKVLKRNGVEKVWGLTLAR